MRPRAPGYSTLDGHRDAVPWYWRVVAVAASILILGGFLMLPTTFDSDKNLRVSQAAVGIFAVAILTAGFSLTALLCFAVRNQTFQADAVFIPALISCALGLLTVFYDFLIASRYVWNTPALLVTVAAAISTVIYGGLLLWTYRRMTCQQRPRMPPSTSSQTTPLARHSSVTSSGSLWQDPVYYENYVRNMYPTSAHSTPQLQSSTLHQSGLPSDRYQAISQHPPPPGAAYDPSSITEEEMQRQQMLMLLLQTTTSPPAPSTAPQTYNIDWPGGGVGRDEEDALTPAHGYYAPTRTQTSSTIATPRPGVVRQLTSDLQTHPWDGVWRGPGPPPPAAGREERRRQIEQGQ